jgi:G3E family GTPase
MRTLDLVSRVLNRQIFFVQDIVLLNKIDLVIGGVAAVAELETQIHNINALVKIVHSERCQVDLDVLFKQRAYEVQVCQN